MGNVDIFGRFIVAWAYDIMYGVFAAQINAVHRDSLVHHYVAAFFLAKQIGDSKVHSLVTQGIGSCWKSTRSNFETNAQHIVHGSAKGTACISDKIQQTKWFEPFVIEHFVQYLMKRTVIVTPVNLIVISLRYDQKCKSHWICFQILMSVQKMEWHHTLWVGWKKWGILCIESRVFQFQFGSF